MDMYARKLLAPLMLVAILFAACASGVMAMGPLTAPRCYLGSTNSWDRLQQVEVSYDGKTVYDSNVPNSRRTHQTSGDWYMYFALDNNYIYQGNYPIAHIAVTYLDNGTQPFALEYDSTSNVYKSLSATRTNTGTWKTITFDVSDAYFGNRQQGVYDLRISDSGTAIYIGAVYVWCRKEFAGRATIVGGEFRNNGTRMPLVGADYIQPWDIMSTDGQGQRYLDWSKAWRNPYYQSATIESDFTAMEIAGVNCIRVCLPWYDYISPSEGTISADCVTNLQDFLQRAQNHGLKCIFTAGGPPNWVNSKVYYDYGGYIAQPDIWVNWEIRKLQADYMVQLANSVNLNNYESFLAFDLQNESSWALWYGVTDQQWYDSIASGPGYSNSAIRGWNRWVSAKYAGLTNAYTAWGYRDANDLDWSVVVPSLSQFKSSGAWDKKVDDYLAFVADSMSQTTKYIGDRLKSGTTLGQNAYVTIDFVVNSGSMVNSLTTDDLQVKKLTNDWRRCGGGCDFLMFNWYLADSTDPVYWREQLAYMVTPSLSKPAVLAEFGWPGISGDQNSLDIQKRTWQQLMGLAATAKLDGCLGWSWKDDSRPEYNGLLYANGTAKPAYTEFCQDKTPFQLASEPTPDVTIQVDMDSFVSPVQQWWKDPTNNRDMKTLVRNLFDAGHYPSVNTKYREYPVTDTLYAMPGSTGQTPATGTLGYGQARGAIITADTIPDFMIAGMSYSSGVTTRNVGINAWSEANSYRLGNQTLNFGNARYFLNAGETIVSGASRAFPMTLTAPTTAATYSDWWGMVQDGVAWFGQTHPHSIMVAAKPTYSARITSHTIPSTVNRSTAFSVSITVRNEGTTTWTEANAYRLGAGGDSDPFAAARQYLAPGDSIAPGQSKTFTFTMTSPATPGCYCTDWQMVRDGYAWFGQKIDVELIVL